MKTVADFKPGDIATLIGFSGEMELQSRLVEMGFVPGVHIRIVKFAPWKGLVEIKIVQLKKRYHIKVRDLVDKLIEDYRPSLFEKPTSGFEDIFNSF